MANDIACPLCNGPTEEHEAYRDRACPRCGLAAPPDVLERIAALAACLGKTAETFRDSTNESIATSADLQETRRINRNLVQRNGTLADENARHIERLRALEAELAQLKQPAHVLAEAVEAWRHRCPCDCRECQGLCEAYANLTGGRDV